MVSGVSALIERVIVAERPSIRPSSDAVPWTTAIIGGGSLRRAIEVSSRRFSFTGIDVAVGSFCVITYQRSTASPSETAFSHRFSVARAAKFFATSLRPTPR